MENNALAYGNMDRARSVLADFGAFFSRVEGTEARAESLRFETGSLQRSDNDT